MSAVEVNFDGLIGPTHSYAGLSEGNLASARNKDSVAQPRLAALQGISKMRRLMGLGLRQGVLAPMGRPNLPWLRSIGFQGSPRAIWEAAWRTDQRLARNAIAASSMWAANAGTVSPSADAQDGRMHFSAANLVTMAHRAQEHEHATRLFGRMFADASRFCVLGALPAQAVFADEGAANHMRLAAEHGAPGVEVFVYGRGGFDPQRAGFPARQTLEAGQAIARRHGLDHDRTLYWLQSGRAVDAGAFHNDVVGVANLDTVFCHEDAFEDLSGVQHSLARASDGLFAPRWAIVPRSQVSLEAAIGSYLFNSQLLTVPGANRMTLIAPAEVAETPEVWACVQAMIADGGPIGAVEVADVRESMRNGGGPACLRLRVVLSDAELAAMTPGFLLTEQIADQLEGWVQRHYREQVSPQDLGDPNLIDECFTALDELTQILPLGPGFYDFQR
ncbi:MAG: N-succinylarginine dihydrolase [Caulobacterales bacterium]